GNPAATVQVDDPAALGPRWSLPATPIGSGDERNEKPPSLDNTTIERLEAAVLKELATVETMRASLGSEPLRPADAERTARTLSLGIPPYAEQPHAQIALIGETEHDVREVMIEGASGLMRAGPWRERPLWSPSRRRLEWQNGAVAQAFSAEDPEGLRGPQF